MSPTSTTFTGSMMIVRGPEGVRIEPFSLLPGEPRYLCRDGIRPYPSLLPEPPNGRTFLRFRQALGLIRTGGDSILATGRHLDRGGSRVDRDDPERHGDAADAPDQP